VDLNLPLLRWLGAQLGLLFGSGGAGTLPAPASGQHAGCEGPSSEEEASLHPADGVWDASKRGWCGFWG
jgi:hypothetical protein